MVQKEGSLGPPSTTPDHGLDTAPASILEIDDADLFGSTRVSSPSGDAWRRFRRNWAAMVSLIVIVIVLIMITFAAHMHSTDPLFQNFNALNQGPSANHWFGTDETGRDEYSRVLYGLRVPLIVGLVGTAITVVAGTVLGVISGYFGGFVDGVLSRFTDLMFAFPGFTLALIVVSLFGQALDGYFGGGGRVLLLTVVFALVSWPSLMRFVRSLALAMKESQFVEAARTCGTSSWGIMFKHLVPNMWGMILVQASFIVIAVISTETILSIFGLGVSEPNPDIGQMLYDGIQRLEQNYWEVIAPSIGLTVSILAFTFIADGLRDAVDPRGRN
ncbi:MAG: ABC transporter permease [Chloroflexota bacterium]